MNLKIGPRTIGAGHPVYVIAEIGNNHNGDFDRAIRMIDLAIDCGANCVKFQMRNLKSVYRKKSLEGRGDDLGTEYILDLLSRFELTVDQHRELFEYCRSKRVTYLCTPWDEESLRVLEGFGVEAYKVASADLTNFPLIRAIAATGKPMILSTGMSTEDEIRSSVSLMNGLSKEFAILHCNSTYPAPFHGIHLNYLKRLREIHPVVGYSGHERGTAVSIAAVALGAVIIERHFTLDREMEGPDHAASLEPEDFKRLVEGIRQVEQALGQSEKKVSQGEMINRENLAKSLVSTRPLSRGTVLRRSDIDVKSPGKGLSPRFLEELVGKTLTRDVKAEDFFYPSDLGKSDASARSFRFSRPWGIPVRYHDYEEFKAMATPDLVEFHFSYKDLELDPADYLRGQEEIDFIVHAPELFAGSRLMDLATPDEAYRKKSIEETNQVLDVTRRLKTFFPKTKRPMIVANVGGFSMDAPIAAGLKPVYYSNFAESLEKLNLEGVELIPQTMAPFPWHFGGQRYQNLFVLPDEIDSICRRTGLRICFDVSHSKLTCNHFGIPFGEFVEKVGPHVAHIHMGDAARLDGEGLQIGEGEIDFVELTRLLKKHCPSAPFIPEIWQGHKDAGGGFWTALERLEKFGF
jgi:N-acetylneuraminate synthase